MTVRDVVFDTGRLGALRATGRDHVSIEQREILNVAHGAVGLNGETCALRSCAIHHVGGFGIWISGGDTMTLRPGNSVVENCDIAHYAWYNRV